MNFKMSTHNALWGSESWEISAHPSDPSVIDGGEFKGATLREVYSDFPLLFKVIDARTRLSVQVHPNEETCKVTGGDFVYNAFKSAEAGFPKSVRLNINDNCIDDRYTNEISRLIAAGAKVDVIGMQMHMFDTNILNEIAKTGGERRTVSFRGFKGRYLLTWTDADGKERSRHVVVK